MTASIPLPVPTRNAHILENLGAATMCVCWLKCHGFEVLGINIDGNRARPLIVIERSEHCALLGGTEANDHDGAGVAMTSNIKGCTVEWVERSCGHA